MTQKVARKPTITRDECRRIWILERLKCRLSVNRGGSDMHRPPSRQLLERLPVRIRRLRYVQAWAEEFVVVDWSGMNLYSDEFRGFWIEAIAADMWCYMLPARARKIRRLVRPGFEFGQVVELVRLYPGVPLDEDTDSTGWVVAADWIQERDGEAIAEAIRFVVARWQDWIYLDSDWPLCFKDGAWLEKCSREFHERSAR